MKDDNVWSTRWGQEKQPCVVSEQGKATPIAANQADNIYTK